MKRLTNGAIDTRPVSFYYQYKNPEKPHPKVKVLTKGTKFTGKFLHTFVDEENGYRSHLIDADGQGKIVIKGAAGLDNALGQCPRATAIVLEFNGQAKPRRKGRKGAYLWTVDADLPDKPMAAAPDTDGPATSSAADAEIEEELPEEVPF